MILLISLEISYYGQTLVILNPQAKEALIDIRYNSLISKNRNTSAGFSAI